MQVRPVRANMRLPLILAVIGVIELTQFFQHNQQHHDTTVVLAALAGSLVLAAVTYTIQRLILQARAQRIDAGPRPDLGDLGTRTSSW
jgi:hypothetical protein